MMTVSPPKYLNAMKQLIRFIVVLFCIHGPLIVAAQDDWKSSTPDQLLILAREESFHGDREKAREMLRYILAQVPEYHDVRVLLGKTYAWDGLHDEARWELQLVLSDSPDHSDALNAMIDVELWSKQYEEALKLTDLYLTKNAISEEMLLKRARICHSLARDAEAATSLNQLLAMNPSHEEAIWLLNSIEAANLKYTAGISYGLDLFSKTFAPAHYSAFEIGRQNKWGSSLFRFNYTNRFEAHGLQGEVDLYPKISQGVYAYLSYAYSSTDLFPAHKAGAEFYFKLPYSFESSVGLRYLHFPEVPEVTIYTGSVGWYFKRYSASARVFVTPQEAGRTSIATSLLLRNYFATKDDYLGLIAGMGFSPDERRLQSGSGLTTEGIHDLRSRRMGLMWSKSFPNRYIFSAEANITRQELGFDQARYVNILHTGVGLKKQF